MSESPNITLVRRLYESGMAPEVAAEIIAPDLVWDITPGAPDGGVYKGWESVGRDFFGHMLPRYASFGARPEEYFSDGDHVFVLGHYEAVSKAGQSYEARFVHTWTIQDDKLARLFQTADSHVLWEAADN